MDIAVPHSTGYERALEVEECACPQGYRGPSCQVRMRRVVWIILDEMTKT